MCPVHKFDMLTLDTFLNLYLNITNCWPTENGIRYRQVKKLQKIAKVENFGVVRTQGPDGKSHTAGACSVSQSDSSI